MPGCRLLTLLFSVSWLLGTPWLRADEPLVASLQAYPSMVMLHGRNARCQLLVFSQGQGSQVDLTRDARFESETPQVAVVDERGVVTPVADGRGVVVAVFEQRRVEVPVEVVRADERPPVSFELDELPVLTARGCNAGACHGKARGQNGFQLSLLGFDPDFDHVAITRHARGRRVFPAQPDQSLLLRKPSGAVPHGGGIRLEPGSVDFATIRRWVAEGMRRRVQTEPTLSHVTVYPTPCRLPPGAQQQLIVTAYYSDDMQRDVTAQTTFQSNESAIVSVDRAGLVSAGPIPGEATIMARFMGQLATCSVSIPLEGRVEPEVYANLPRLNFIDGLVWKKLASLGVIPSQPADDAKFMRRVYLDIIGRVPTTTEARRFLDDSDPQKREYLVDLLLERPEYADHWANKWVDLLRPNPYRVGIKTVMIYDNWIRDCFRQNMPYDQFVWQLITARGSTWHNGATTLFRDRRSPDELVTMVSQLFLGIRLGCAKCHHHPFEKWGQEDYYSLAAYFARVGRKGTGISPPISGSEEIVLIADKGEVKHPITGQVLDPRPLFGQTPELSSGEDPRQALARWMTSDDNLFFSQVIANRIWAELMGRGLVEPVDDLRITNPPSNGPLLKELAAELRREKYNLKKLIRAITLSHVYGLSSLPGERNVADTRGHSRFYRQRLRAEVLMDAVCDITGVPGEFPAMPPDSRAAEIWTHRIGSLFLDTFGRPDPNQDPPCERVPDTTMSQALHLMNSPELHAKVTSDEGTAAALANDKEKNPIELVDELYLLVYNRFPTSDERAVGEALYGREGVSRRQVTEDVMWALLNTPEFVFKD